MDEKLLVKLKLGIFATAGMLMLLLAIYFLGAKKNLFTSTLTLHAVFKDVNGLQSGQKVRFVGIDIGEVSFIEINSDSTAKVTFEIDDAVQAYIKKDAVASIQGEGLMGNRILAISSDGSTAEHVRNGDELRTLQPIKMEDILSNVNKTAVHAEIITENLAQITTRISQGKGMVGKLFIDSSFTEDFSETLENVKEGTEQFNNNMKSMKHAPIIGKMIQKGEKRRKKDKN